MFGSKAARPNSTPPETSLRVQTSVAGLPRPLGWGQNRISGNLIWYGDFVATPQASPAAQGGKGLGGTGGGKGQSGSVQYTYSAAVVIALSEGPISGVLNLWNNKTEQSLASLNFVVGTGAYTQDAWTYLQSNHPDQALDYRGIAWVAAGPLQLGTNPELPNLSFEVLYAINGAIPGLPDADPADVVIDLLTNQFYGLPFPSSRLGDLSLYSSYCRAAGLVVSPSLTSQGAANSFLADLMLGTNSEFVWTGSKLIVVPYGDTALSANGASYTPPDDAPYSLDDDDFLPPQGTGASSAAVSTNDPVQISRQRPAEQINDIKIEYLDRSNAYNPEVAEAKDEAAIQLYGLKSGDKKQLHMFCDGGVALLSAQLQLGRQQIRNLYSFTVGPEYILLDPMDIVPLTDLGLGLEGQRVRIREIQENDDRSLSITAEEVLSGSGNSPAYSKQANSGHVPNYNVDPGDANAPVLFAAPVALAPDGLDIWVAVSGSGANWGSADVWVSSDNATYRKVGTARQPARMGVLSTPFAAGSDPDTVNTLSVDLSGSKGSLLGGTKDDADQAHTLCYVDGEFIAYQQATLTAEFKYDLGVHAGNVGYLRRGVYGSAISAHEAGTSFVRCDDSLVAIPYTKEQIGATLFVKLTSLNLWQGGEQELADVAAYTLTLPPPPAPADVKGFAATQSGNVVAFAWDAIDSVALKGYDIGYAPQGTTDWSLFTMLTEAAAGTEMTNAEVPPGNWTFGIRARDIADQLSPDIATLDLTVENKNPIIYSTAENPNWPGTLTNLVRHYTGVLIPENQFTPSHYSDYSDIDAFVIDPFTSGDYTTLAIDTGIDDTLRVFDTTTLTLGPGQSGAPSVSLEIDTWLTGETDPGTFTPWTIGFVTMRYLRERIVYSGIAAGQVAVITGFTPDVDKAPSVEQGNSQTVAPGGTMVTFPAPFHFPPFVTATAIGDTALYVTAVNVTSSQCTLHVWDATGTDVGGTVNWNAVGE